MRPVSRPAAHASRSRRAAGWLVHALTASGAVWGLLAVLAIDGGRYSAAFCWMAAATATDGVDGALARRAGVSRSVPGIDGTLLDNLVDYLNYVFVPAYLLVRADVVPGPLGLAAAALICVASLFQFARVDAKTDDLLFTGFPSYWNVVALYVVLLRPPAAVTAAVVAILCTLVFVPIRYVYPSRTRILRWPTLVLTLAWALCALLLVFELDEPRPWLVWTSLLYVAYYFGLSVALTVRRRRTA